MLRALLALVLGLVSLGCAPERPAESPWTMPRLAVGGSGRGYLFAQPGAPGSGADSVTPEGEPAGDFPEMAAPGERGLWRSDERHALAEARALGRGLVIDFWAEWCEACWRFERETFGDPDVRGALAEHFVALRIDVTEETRENREQLQRYAVVRLPTVLFLDSEGQEIDRLDAFVAPEAMMGRLASARSRRGVHARAP